ncbi:hypothetical protein J3R30DRAFT_1611392 [Lentinula aciculospora]|uniref:Uncharacterized protein n=1 Tax=Lentinula aciculospora TaxID=153920 RepID=A0A9W8ZXD5_9AGAR|nr:hypothetical protein J3R30DRAFT_1611392 [Lentinula aciculospora]
MSLHHWRTPLYSHERANPPRSSYVTAGEKPLFSVEIVEESEHDVNTNDEMLRSFHQDYDTEAYDASTYSSNSSLMPHYYHLKEEIPQAVDFHSASHLPSVFVSPSLHQEFEQVIEDPMQFSAVDYSSGLSFPLGISPEDGNVFMPNPFKFGCEHDKVPLGQSNLQMDNLLSATPTNTTIYALTASDDTSSPSDRGMSRATRIQSSLDILRAGRISPVEFLTEVLDVTNPRSAQFRGKLYSKTNKRLDDLLDKIIEDPMGEMMIEDWFRKYDSRKKDATCEKENILSGLGSGNAQYYRRY